MKETISEADKLAFDPDAVVESVTVEITAPAEQVWDVLVDFERYREWNPFCVEAEGILALGEPLPLPSPSKNPAHGVCHPLCPRHIHDATPSRSEDAPSMRTSSLPLRKLDRFRRRA